jgi:hypothetical protein
MPLNLAALTDTPGLPGAQGRAYPASRIEAAIAWADALGAWVADIVPPSSTVSAARQQLEEALDGAFAAGGQSEVAAAMEAALAAFAVTLGAGMAPLVPTPPAGPVGFVALFAAPYPSTRQEAIAAFAARLDAWIRTGFSTLPAPPGTVTPWT